MSILQIGDPKIPQKKRRVFQGTPFLSFVLASLAILLALAGCAGPKHTSTPEPIATITETIPQLTPTPEVVTGVEQATATPETSGGTVSAETRAYIESLPAEILSVIRDRFPLNKENAFSIYTLRCIMTEDPAVSEGYAGEYPDLAVDFEITSQAPCVFYDVEGDLRQIKAIFSVQIHKIHQQQFLELCLLEIAPFPLS